MEEDVKVMELTINEALQQGYLKYGIAGRDWQTAEDLDDGVFYEVPEDEWDNIVLFQKRPSYPTISADRIADLLADVIGEDDSMECGRDDDAVYNTVKEFDFSDITVKLNTALEQHKYWMLTDIKLIQKIVC